jgi:hypothetical protein
MPTISSPDENHIIHIEKKKGSLRSLTKAKSQTLHMGQNLTFKQSMFALSSVDRE